MTAYRITNWDRLYENSETRKIKRLSWVPTRNKHDGLGYRLMTREAKKIDLFCAWNLMLQVASKGEGRERGTLVRDGVALTPDDLAMMTGFPSGIFKLGMEFFSNCKVGWLEAIREISGDHPELSGACPAEQNRTEGTEQKELVVADAPAQTRFVKPEPEAVTEYARGIGFTLDGQYFCDKYDGNGWMVGKSKMKDWKAVVRTWKKNDGNGGNGHKPVRKESVI